jgi:hypothetical protein
MIAFLKQESLEDLVMHNLAGTIDTVVGEVDIAV